MPFDPNPTGDLKGDMNFQELARGLDQLFEGGVVVNDLGEDVDFRVEGDAEPNLLFVDASTGRVGIGTASPAATLHVLSAAVALRLQAASGAIARQQFQGDSGQIWEFRIASGATTFAIRDQSGGTNPVNIVAGAPTNSLMVWATGAVTLGPGSPRFIGRTATAADPTTTELPTDKDFGLHKNTSSGAVFLAYNDGGAIKKVALT